MKIQILMISLLLFAIGTGLTIISMDRDLQRLDKQVSDLGNEVDNIEITYALTRGKGAVQP